MIDANIDYLLKYDFDDFVTKVKIDEELRKKVTQVESLINININASKAREAIDVLQNIELEKLIKIYTIFDKDIIYMGSVTAIPSLIDALIEREYGFTSEIIDWVIAYNNGNNDYLPFGNLTYSHCKSYREYLDFKKLKQEQANLRKLEEEKIKLEKSARLQIKAEKDIWNAIERRDIKAIEAIVKHGVNLEMTNDDGFSVRELIDRFI